MRFSTSLLAAFSSLAAIQASPIERRDHINDGVILNYALTLEHLENAFYKMGLSNFTEQDFTSAFSSDFYQKIKTVSLDEQTHVDFLTGALKTAGIPSVAPCEYAFPVTDVKGFVAVASVLEGVGVSAYLGAAASIMEKAYLTAAGSVLTVEARHSAYIRSANGQAPFAQPFDTPLTFNEVFSLATAFITSCPPENPPLPLKAFPALTLQAGTEKIMAGSEITLLTSVPVAGMPVYAAFITVLGPVFAGVVPCEGGLKTTVPASVNGQSYIILTDCMGCEVTDDNTIAGPAIVEISNY